MILATYIATNPKADEYRILKITYSDLTFDAKKQIDCLAQNIYHEAGNEAEVGKVAVALVTMNRVEDPRFPKDICGVVKQKTAASCQFSWFCAGVSLNRNSDMYKRAEEVALHVYANYEYIDDITNGSLYYHADYVNPQWKLKKTTVIGRHIFYKDYGNNDAKTKPATKRRQLEALILSTDGRYYS
jgi:spore germination cell wall hydrolase CwlJ-like protein